VAKRIKAAVLQDAALQQELMGNWNFFNVSFPIRYPSCTAEYHKGSAWLKYTRTDTSSNPMIVNIESGGRYVATVCHENIEGLDLWVCYPIYEGKVNLACGLGVDENNLCYDVRWIQNEVTLTPLEDVAGTNFYITNGDVRVTPTEKVNYAESHALPYIELDGGVTPDGTYNVEYVFEVQKENGTFIAETNRLLASTVGWTEYTQETSTLPTGTTLHFNKYTRDANYTYIYNPNELRYVE